METTVAVQYTVLPIICHHLVSTSCTSAVNPLKISPSTPLPLATPPQQLLPPFHHFSFLRLHQLHTLLTALPPLAKLQRINLKSNGSFFQTHTVLPLSISASMLADPVQSASTPAKSMGWSTLESSSARSSALTYLGLSVARPLPIATASARSSLRSSILHSFSQVTIDHYASSPCSSLPYPV